jgi:hypothetical protein
VQDTLCEIGFAARGWTFYCEGYRAIKETAGDSQVNELRCPAFSDHTALEEVYEDLVASLQQHPFPYRLCPQCKVRVFVREKRPGRKLDFCSTPCQQRWNDAKRGSRAAYRKDLRKKKQERAKARAKAEARAKKQALAPVVKVRGTLTGNREKR